MERILFLSTIYPRAYDPTRGTYCHATCKALAGRGEVCVVSPRPWLEAWRRPSPQDARMEGEVGRIVYPTYFYLPRVAAAAQHDWMWRSIRKPLRAVAAEFRPQAILSYWAHPDGAVAVRLGRELGVPAGIIVGGSDVLLLPQDPARRRAVVEALRGAHAVFAVSRELREKSIALGVEPARAHVVLQGVDEAFTPGERAAARRALGLEANAEILVWVGRMAPVKGLEVLLQAMRLLAPRRPQLQLHLVGDGAPRAALEREVAAAGLAAHVRFAGAVRPERLPDWYRAADLTVLSSHSEGIPNVLRESLACGTPYVATRVGSIAELHTGPEARLVPPRAPAAFADAVEAMLQAPRRVPADVVRRGWDGPGAEMVKHLEAA